MQAGQERARLVFFRFGDQLDPAIVEITDESGDFIALRDLPGAVPEADALNPSREKNVRTFSHFNRARTLSGKAGQVKLTGTGLATFPVTMRPWILILLLAGPAVAAPRWETLENCRLVHHDGNDGDSFHVEANGREYIFRLYFVDTPEVEDDFPERVAEQAKYFGISHRRALEVGRAAARFTARQLDERFTVLTRWEDARGRSKLARHYAVVLTSQKKDLGQLLVQNGLARVFGDKAILPNGDSVKAVEQKLNSLQRQARSARVGGWAYANSSILAGTDQSHRLAVTSGERHNRRCPLFNVPGNRECSPEEGRPCRLCGG